MSGDARNDQRARMDSGLGYPEPRSRTGLEVPRLVPDPAGPRARRSPSAVTPGRLPITGALDGLAAARKAATPPILVINLKWETERWQKIESSLRRRGFSCTRISAVDSRRRMRLVHSRIERSFYSESEHRSLTPGEICCALSHIAALKRVVRGHMPYAIVMEDDAVIGERFERFVAEDLPAFFAKCDVVKLEGFDIGTRDPKRGLVVSHGACASLLVPFRPTMGAAAYAVTLAGAIRLLRRFSALSDTLDHMLVYYEWHGIRYGEVRPVVVWQDTVASSLATERQRAQSGRVPARSPRALCGLIVHGGVRRALRLLALGYCALRFRTLTVDAI
jgi:glycosyl transferase, family 25